MQPIYEVANRQVNIDTFNGVLQYAGRDGNSRALYRPYKNQWMPRTRLRLDAGHPRTTGCVVRAGWAYMSFMEGTGANLRLPLNPPFFIETNFNYDVNAPGSIRTGFADVVTADIRLDMPRPAGTVVPQLQGRAWHPDLRPQTTSQVNFTLEYQIDKSTSISAGYVGQKGTHLVAPG